MTTEDSAQQAQPMKVLLPTNIPDIRPDTVPDLPGVTWAWADPGQPVPDEHCDAEVWAAWMNPNLVLQDAAARMPNLRLVQSFSAGVEAILAAGFAPDVQVATGAGLHDRTVAEHVLALLLALVRRIPDSVRDQAAHSWQQDDRIDWQRQPGRRVHTLHGANVLIWGYGTIGQALAPMLQALGARVQGVARTAGVRAGVDVIDAAGLAQALPGTDVLVMLLPGGDQTRHTLDAATLAQLPSHALVLNAGRGSVIDQAALIAALEAGSIAGAGLDVVDPEPLPAGDPLWDAPNLLITPHHGGGRPIDALALLADNIRALQSGESVRNLWQRG